MMTSVARARMLSALVGRFHEARVAGADVVTIWGSGTPKREFVYSDDVAAAVFHLLDTDTPRDRCVNIGTGVEVTILELARLVATVVGFEGRIELDVSKPDGAPRKLLDSAFLRETGWVPRAGRKRPGSRPNQFSGGQTPWDLARTSIAPASREERLTLKTHHHRHLGAYPPSRRLFMPRL